MMNKCNELQRKQHKDVFSVVKSRMIDIDGRNLPSGNVVCAEKKVHLAVI